MEDLPARDIEGPPAVNFLEGIDGTSSSDLWVVGYARRPSMAGEVLVEHFDGATWTVATVPNVSTNSEGLIAVDAFSTDDVWAVGWRFDFSLYEQPLVLRRTGGTWAEVPAPALPFCSRARSSSPTSRPRPRSACS